MQKDRVYKKIKGRLIQHNGYSGTVCGMCDGKYIAATLDRPSCCFRRLDKKTDSWVEDEYKDVKWKYFYVNEIEVHRQYPKLKRI